MMITGKLDHQYSRFTLWTLGPGPARLHFRDERITVNTVGDIRTALTERGVTDIYICGPAWEVKNDAVA